MERLGIIGAMASEVTHLTEQMEEKTVTRAAGLRFYDGTLMGCPVVVAECGVGKVCAAVCAQVMIDRFRVTGLVNTGVAGGLHPELKVGDIVIGTDAVQHDFDLTATGAVKGYLFGEDESVPTRFHSDPTLVAAFKRAADKILTGGKTYREGTIASGDIFVADPALKRDLVERYGAAAAEMEGAAIAQVAAANAVPAVIIRAISDLAGEKAEISFAEFEQEAAALSAQIVMEMLAQLGKKREE